MGDKKAEIQNLTPNFVVGFKQLLTAVTVFTIAHSITLVLATLGVVHVPAAPTEAIIALSILFLATEIVHKHNGQFSLTKKHPWLVALAFGLFHGLGFACCAVASSPRPSPRGRGGINSSLKLPGEAGDCAAPQSPPPSPGIPPLWGNLFCFTVLNINRWLVINPI